jgi:RNA polymerase sigma-70 factor (ECF subfamily)
VTIDGPGEFAQWVTPHVPVMGLLASRMVGPADRDDVVQEALTRAWRKRSQFDESRGTPRAWLLAIVADRARRHRRRAPRSLLLPARPPVAAPDGARVDLDRALATLAPRMRLAVDCVYFVDLSIAETARVMGVSEGTVKSTLFDARARLRAALEEL